MVIIIGSSDCLRIDSHTFADVRADRLCRLSFDENGLSILPLVLIIVFRITFFVDRRCSYAERLAASEPCVFVGQGSGDQRAKTIVKHGV